jgi:hypothetical protein
MTRYAVVFLFPPGTTAEIGDAFRDDSIRGRADVINRDLRVSFAAEYVRDALDGSTHLTFRRESRFARQIAKTQRTFLYVLVLRTALLLNLCFLFFEPTTRHSAFERKARIKTLATELSLVGFFVITALLDLARLGFERYRAKHWRFIFFFGAVAIFIDACVASAAVSFFQRSSDGTLLTRPTRCLRPSAGHSALPPDASAGVLLFEDASEAAIDGAFDRRFDRGVVDAGRAAVPGRVRRAGRGRPRKLR